MDDRSNIVLIGMPGAGKSTVGVLLAKAARRSFLDTDVYLQSRLGRSLQEILDAEGLEAFLEIEAGTILSLNLAGHVIATGGSAVYRDAAMEHLGAGGPLVYLQLPYELLEARVTNMATRGVVIARGQSFRDLYDRREPLYRRWAQLTVACEGKSQDEIAAEIAGAL